MATRQAAPRMARSTRSTPRTRARAAHAPTTRARSSQRRSVKPPRPAIVWASLIAAMTGAGGLLLALDGGGRSPLDGMRLPGASALMAVNRPRSIEAVLATREPLDRERWRSIMVHHSGAAFGTAESLERDARAIGLRGLGHHFVIGNGNGMGDGEVFVGRRWLEQAPGAHAVGEPERADWYNRHAISICLVGDGNRREFTQAQMQRLAELVLTLARELGIPPEQVLLHSDTTGVPDPGVRFPAAAFRELAAGLE